MSSYLEMMMDTTPTESFGGVVRKLRDENASLRRQVERLMVYRQMAYRDCLTGLHNRRYFKERLREECARASRDAGYSFSMIMIDIDSFKQINDTLRHGTGDDVLVAVAGFLNRGVREVDIVCRLGGDEFALLLPNTDEIGAAVVEARLRRAVAQGEIEARCTVGLSLGAASFPPGAADESSIIARADAAMYSNKRNRKRRMADAA